jgi:hypothetical protein
LKPELEDLRARARSRIESGAVPEWSWAQHVALIEAIDSVLHDMAVLGAPTDRRRSAAGGLRLVGTDDARSLTELSLGMTQPVQYQRRRHNLR